MLKSSISDKTVSAVSGSGKKLLLIANRVKNDVNGNPRYQVTVIFLDSGYSEALDHKYQSYNIEDTLNYIAKQY